MQVQFSHSVCFQTVGDSNSDKLLCDILIFLLTYLLTPWCRVLLEKLTGSQLVKKFPAFHYPTHKRPSPVSILGQPNPVHIPTSHILEIHPNINHPSMPRSPQWSPSLRFLHQDPIHPLSSPIRATCPAHLILLHFITRTILGEEYKSFSSSLCNLLHSLVTSSQVQIFSSTPCSQTPSASFPPAMSKEAEGV